MLDLRLHHDVAHGLRAVVADVQVGRELLAHEDACEPRAAGVSAHLKRASDIMKYCHEGSTDAQALSDEH